MEKYGQATRKETSVGMRQRWESSQRVVREAEQVQGTAGGCALLCGRSQPKRTREENRMDGVSARRW